MGSQDELTPLVTAILICYNQAAFVVDALESIKAQGYPNLYLVAVDDFSRDNSVDLIRRWLSENFANSLLVAHDRNYGVCRTVNDGLANAKGKYIRLLAADDLWIPNTLSRQVEIMEASSPETGVLYSDARQIDESGTLLPNKFIETHRTFERMPEGWIFDSMIEGNFIPGMTALLRLHCFEVVGGADETLSFEDWDLWLKLSRQFMFKYFPEPTADYRVVSTSMTRVQFDRVIQSEQRILVNCLRRGWLKGERKQQAIDIEFRGAYWAYQERLPNRLREAAWAFWHRRCFKHTLLLIAVALGIPYRWFDRFKILLRRPSS